MARYVRDLFHEKSNQIIDFYFSSEHSTTTRFSSHVRPEGTPRNTEMNSTIDDEFRIEYLNLVANYM